MLTPMEIQNKKFEKAVMGYDKNDVNDFMLFVSEDYETLYKQSMEQEEKIKGLTKQLETYKNIDETMKNTLLVAQSTAETVQKNATEKAELIIREAEAEAKRILENAKKETEKSKLELEQIRHDMDIFRCKAISMLNAQMENMKNFSIND
ncbi:MAG: DivIVA domain-containing protein [Clostridia bacterium]|nr:DivIVA domain-containing protein [Clostridia bacterium]